MQMQRTLGTQSELTVTCHRLGQCDLVVDDISARADFPRGLDCYLGLCAGAITPVWPPYVCESDFGNCGTETGIRRAFHEARGLRDGGMNCFSFPTTLIFSQSAVFNDCENHA